MPISTDDRIDLIHLANYRSIFVKVAIEAAVFLSKQKKGIYSIKDVVERSKGKFEKSLLKL